MENIYKRIVKSEECHENKIKNALLSFFSGGILGLIGQGIFKFLSETKGLSDSEASMYVFLILVFVASLLTGFGFFDKIVAYFKAGLIVPATGFAHAMTSSVMDSNRESLVASVGACIFKLTGSIILYGIVAAIVCAFLKGVIM